MASGTIDQLNFEVILNDKDFNARIQKDINTAQQLNTSLSKALKINVRPKQIISATGIKNAKEMVGYLDEITRKIQAMPKGNFLIGDADKLNATLQKVNENLDKMVAKQNQHAGAVGKSNAALTSTTSIMRTLTQLTGATFSVIGIRRFLSSLIDITGQFEMQKMALRNMLQDVSSADRIFRQLYDFSSESTYRFSELAKYAKQLAGFQIGKDNLLETTKMLGDVASGLGISMDRLILAYGHVKSSGFLRGIQLRSFSQNGVPILKELSDMFTEIEGKAVSMGDVFDKMTKREIPFEMVEEAFRRMTSEGGQFYKMQEVLAKTLAGQINILKGKWENAMYAMGQSRDKWLKGGVQMLTYMVNHIEQIGAALKPVIAGFGAYGLALAAASMGNWIAGAARAVEYFVIIAKRANLATAAIRVFGSTTKAVAASLGVLSAAIAIIVSLVQTTAAARREMDEFNRSLDEIHKTARDTSALDAEVSKIDSLRKVVDNSNNSLDARRAALDRLKQIVPDYHASLTEEGRLINNNKIALDKYIEALNREAKMKGAQDELTALYGKKREVEKEVADARKNVDAIQVGASFDTQYATSYGYAFVAIGQSANKANKELKLAEQKLSAIDAQIESINNEIADTIGLTAPDSPAEYNIKQIISNIEAYDADIKKIRDAAKKGTITAEQKNELESLMSFREDQAKLYEDILGIKYDKDNKATGSSRAPKLDPLEKAVIDILEGTEKDIDGTLTKLLERDTKDLEKTLDRREKALTDYEKFFKDWSGMDFGKKGEGAMFKVSSAVTEYNNKNKDADDKYYKGLALATEGHKRNTKAIEQEAKKLRELRDAQKEMNKAEFRERIRSIADDIFKEGMQGFDLTNWNDKTLSQIKAIEDAIKKVEVSDEIKKELEGDTEAARALVDALNRIKQDTLQNTVEPERFKKVAKESKRLAGYISTAAQKMKDLAEATGNTNLSELAEVVGMLAQNIQAAADGAEAWGGWWGAIIGGITDLIDQFSTGITQAISNSKELADTLREIKEEAWIASQTALFSNGGVFGDEGLKNIRGAVEAMRNLRDSMASMGDPEVVRSMNFWDKLSLGHRMMHNPDHIADEEFTNQGRLSEAMRRYGLNVYDRYGNFDAASIREIIKLFGDESGALERLARDSEAYAEAMKAVEDVAKEVFGIIASEVTDKLVDSWWEAGNAALDYADILGDVAKAYAKLVVQDMLMETAFDEGREKALMEAFRNGDASKAMQIVTEAMQSAESMLPAVNAALQAFEPYRNVMEATDANSVGNGFKGITEDTANLLASYMNAIRADVSYMRVMQEKGWTDVAAIAGAVASPTLNDYLAQIAATNFDIAQAMQAVLSELQSVIGAPGTSGMVVRVESY